MYEANSKKQPNLVYVFDEFKLPGESIAEHPKLENHGRVTETLEFSLETPTADIKLIDILKDCNRFPVFMMAEKGDYDVTISYIRSILSEKALRENNIMVYIHKLDTSK